MVRYGPLIPELVVPSGDTVRLPGPLVVVATTSCTTALAWVGTPWVPETVRVSE